MYNLLQLLDWQAHILLKNSLSSVDLKHLGVEEMSTLSLFVDDISMIETLEKMNQNN